MIQVLAAWTFSLVLETRCIQCYVYGLPRRSMLLGLLFALTKADISFAHSLAIIQPPSILLAVFFLF